MEKRNLKIIIVLLSILVVGAAALFVYQTNNSLGQANLSKVYLPDDKDKPALVVEPDSRINDLGVMKADEERTARFMLRNAGSAPLVISKIRTSCMCTFGQIIAGDKKSPLVNMEMHNSLSAKKWATEIKPGESAVAEIIYRPALMPVQGPVERLFLFETNDPTNSSVELTIKAFVEI